MYFKHKNDDRSQQHIYLTCAIFSLFCFMAATLQARDMVEVSNYSRTHSSVEHKLKDN